MDSDGSTSLYQTQQSRYKPTDNKDQQQHAIYNTRNYDVNQKEYKEEYKECKEEYKECKEEHKDEPIYYLSGNLMD